MSCTVLQRIWQTRQSDRTALRNVLGQEGMSVWGDVSNVVFTNGAIVNERNEVYIYYASSDTRLHVATTTVEKLTDYVFHTPQDPGRFIKPISHIKKRCKKSAGSIFTTLIFLMSSIEIPRPMSKTPPVEERA